MHLHNSYLPSFFILCITLSQRWMPNQLVRMINSTIFLVTSIANIIICANFTSPTLTSFYIKVTNVASCHKCWCRGIMKVVKDHHRGMFSTPQGIILVMISLTKAQKCLSCIKKLTLENFIFIFGVMRYILDFNLANIIEIS